jgi:hypothetical protein
MTCSDFVTGHWQWARLAASLVTTTFGVRWGLMLPLYIVCSFKVSLYRKCKGVHVPIEACEARVFSFLFLGGAAPSSGHSWNISSLCAPRENRTAQDVDYAVLTGQ